MGDDFALWIRRFEAYARAVKIPDEALCDALLALLDDAAFRAFDLLDLGEEIVTDFKKLTEALRKRFAPSTGLHELRFSLGQREQGPSETLDEYADALVLLANRAYPELETKLRMGLALDQFMAGIRNEHTQDILLQSPPETLDAARETAKRLEAAQAARKRMRSKKQQQVNALGSWDEGQESDDGNSQGRLSAHTSCPNDLALAVRRNTEMLEKLLVQLTLPSGEARASSQHKEPQGRPRRPRRPLTCWQCRELGHVQRNCPNYPGNEQRLAPWAQRQPRTQ